jgi:glucosyl-3-phosphoglycerate synthase
VLEKIPFVTGYGVELGLLIDLLDLAGLDALAQVDLGRRVHSHQSIEALGGMAAQILQTSWSRLERQNKMVSLHTPSTLLAQFRRDPDGAGGYHAAVRDVAIAERPPMITIPGYHPRLAG